MINILVGSVSEKGHFRFTDDLTFLTAVPHGGRGKLVLWGLIYESTKYIHEGSSFMIYSSSVMVFT